MTEPIDLTRPRRLHLVGVGGAGMSGIARIALQRGHAVSGTDLQEGRFVDELRALGGRVDVGHDPEAIGDAEIVVVSTAVPEDNPEVVAARDRGVPVVRRAAMLAALMEGQRRVLIAGSHGKTTTTSMLVVGLHMAGLDPSYAIGGQLNETGTNAHAGADDVFVAEADESDRSFLLFEPDVAVVTNIELDHPDEFADDDEITAAFGEFLDRRPAGGVAVLGMDDERVAGLVSQTRGPVVTFGEDPRADVRLVLDDGSDPRVRIGDATHPLQLAVPGRHNLLNATAALAACHHLGADTAAAAAGLARFRGAQRRYQVLGTARGVTVVDDYAHHPTELRTTLSAARAQTEGRILVVVQPHRFSRTEVLGAELGRAAAAADVVVVTEIYASSEQPKPGVTGRIVADAAEAAGANVVWQPHLAAVPDEVAALAEPGDLVLVTGAGDVTQVGPALLRLLGDARG